MNITDHGALIQTLTLSPTTSTNARYAYSEATYTLTQPPGGSAFFFGKHSVSASFIPSGTFLKSSANKTFTVSPAAFTPGRRRLIATVTPGSGPEIQSGQTANVFYTGYLAKNGHIFDDSINDGGTPLSFKSVPGPSSPASTRGRPACRWERRESS